MIDLAMDIGIFLGALVFLDVYIRIGGWGVEE